MSLEYSVVDAFTSRAFSGNPAAVVLGGDELPDLRMQQIAAEFNLSETVFVLLPAAAHANSAVRLRWFTPQCEVSFCGHASLAAVHAYFERNAADQPNSLRPDSSGERTRRGMTSTGSARPDHRVIDIECAAGNLVMKMQAASHGSPLYWLSMPRPEIQPIRFSAAPLLDALGLSPHIKLLGAAHRTRDRDVILFLARGDDVRTVAPDPVKLHQISRQHDLRGVSLASTDTGDAEVACISRFFAPAAGIAEDPVTGSVHGPLAAFLIQESHVREIRPGTWSFVCRQVPSNGRVGEIHVRAERRGAEPAIEIGGACVTVMTGRIVA